jgi:hypothetical protein
VKTIGTWLNLAFSTELTEMSQQLYEWQQQRPFQASRVDEAKADGKMSQVGRSREIKWGLSILEEPAVSARAGQVHTE